MFFDGGPKRDCNHRTGGISMTGFGTHLATDGTRTDIYRRSACSGEYGGLRLEAGNTWVVKTLSQPATVTAYAFNSSNDMLVQFANTANGMTFELFVPGGSQVTGSFDYPLSVHKFVVSCQSSSDCLVGFSVVGD